MINFDGVDFSECHSEEVISFFWRSVYDGQSERQTCDKHAHHNVTVYIFFPFFFLHELTKW